MGMQNRFNASRMERVTHRGPLPGIVIHGRRDERPSEPRIHAFVWGGKVPSAPALDFGRRQGAA